MFFWKIDEETIRCLINKQEIDSMGYDIQTLNEDDAQMESFLDAIVQNSQNYIEWHTENGVQKYAARALPMDQLLITISCSFPDDVIDQNLDQIQRMKKALNLKITEERLKEVYALSGEEKEEAFSKLAQDLNEVCNGNVAETSPQKDAGKRLPGRELIFVKFDDVLRFCSMLDARFFYDSTLYKEAEEYILLVDFAKCSEDSEAVSFILMAEEYDAVCREIGFDEAYLKEHGQVLLPGNAIEMLNMMSR